MYHVLLFAILFKFCLAIAVDGLMQIPEDENLVEISVERSKINCENVMD